MVAASPLLPKATEPATGGLVDIEGERFYRIDGVDRMAPFLTTVASDSDHWMFVSSTGGLTAGRKSPDHALFPYTTDDRLHEAIEHTGPKTVLRVRDEGGGWALWEPLSDRYAGLWPISRSLSKSVVGNQLRFEEVNQALGVAFAYTWMPSDRFGFVREVELRAIDDRPVVCEMLDGVQNLLPAGLGRRFQMEMSTLGDGYKDSELDPTTGLGVFRLSSIPVDSPEPSEALAATTVFVCGLPGARAYVDAGIVEAFRRGQERERPRSLRLRGQRGGYFVNASLTLAPGAAPTRFCLIANVEQDAADVVGLQRLLRSSTDVVATVMADARASTTGLVAIVAAADGLAVGGDELSCARHFSNVMFNCMRGGIPANGYTVDRSDFARFVGSANRRVAKRHAALLSELPPSLPHSELLRRADDTGDPALGRLAHEYLPLTFSRRHGDPSRPWNLFSIAVRDPAGGRQLDYQGNWRDIFQNWEALARSFPGYAISMIRKFVGSSTADGHNPYRVSRDGFDWEVLDPHDPWSHIGYWGDHQIIYLQRLMEVAAAHDPTALTALLDQRVFGYADVPYRIKPYEELLRDPHATIDFDRDAHRAALARVEDLGHDGRLLAGRDGQIELATLSEKLVVMTIAKLANFVPEVGLWMNTQRPEWNDANNALVGYGASMVTVAHLRRFLAFVRDLVAAGPATLDFATELAELLTRTNAALAEMDVRATFDDQGRRAFLDAVARPFSDYRTRLYRQGRSGVRATISALEIARLCSLALPHIDRALAANRRPDGLYHSYNLLAFTEAGIGVRRLDLMLEGQVAALSSGALDPSEAVVLLRALRNSVLFRRDQGSYLLYPDKTLPGFLEKNRLDAAAVAASPLLVRLLETNHRDIVVRDVEGHVHFASGLRNGRLLDQALEKLAKDAPAIAGSEVEKRQVLALYEATFDHHSFTGRSGTLYKYEGLGCIYWHMVSKLRLAVHEIIQTATRIGSAALPELTAHHREICAGIGVSKTPPAYGAFPIDAYSHTPGFAGVQQPGMTGQVKEDIVARMGELGVEIKDGRLGFVPQPLGAQDFVAFATTMLSLDLDGRSSRVAVPPGALAFHICQVPVVMRRAGPVGIAVAFADGAIQRQDGLRLDADLSLQIFARTGRVRRLEVTLGL